MPRMLLMAATLLLTAAVLLGTAVATGTAAYCSSPAERELLRLINDYRRSNGRDPLAISQTLGAAARHHSVDMAKRNYLRHTTKGTRIGPGDRIEAHDYPYIGQTALGENIYGGYGTRNGTDLGSAEAAFHSWKNSPGHNKNMLSRRFTTIGIGRVHEADSKYKNYWTTDFAGKFDREAKRC
jgi:uncharacterized protein YkwD